MASNSFGQIFRFTTFGESHGKAIGVIVDGCPAGLEISENFINQELAKRQPGKSPYTSPRKEKDSAEILSGIFEGKTTGAPISVLIWNKDADSSKYKPIKNLLRPGHANFTYLEKYGIFDYRGGGRSSARETAARVAAGAIAKKLLEFYEIELVSFVDEIGGISIAQPSYNSLSNLKKKVHSNPIFCPDSKQAKAMMQEIEKAKNEKDSLGGVLSTIVTNLPIGLGEPIYLKMEAMLAWAMLSLPATKGFEIGSGFKAARMKGSEHNDAFDIDRKGQVTTQTNHAGGVLGGITTGLPLSFRVPFKPTSSIAQTQQTVSLKKEKKAFKLPAGSRHDPCVAIRAVPIVEAMTACVIADALLMDRLSKI